jgi:hypothetical protein
LHEQKSWCGWRGSNPRPLASEANTLSTELQPQQEYIVLGGRVYAKELGLRRYNLGLLST